MPKKIDKSLDSVRVYDLIAEDYAAEFSKPSIMMDDFLSLLPSGVKLVDIGCGHGIDCANAHSKGFDIIGIDLSEQMLSIARRNHLNIDFQLADMRKLNLPHREFDGVISSCSLIHVPKDEVPKTLRQIADLLKKGGLLYLWMLSSPKSQELFVNEPLRPGEKTFVNVVSINEINSLLNDADFEVIQQHESEQTEEGELGFANLVIFARKV